MTGAPDPLEGAPRPPQDDLTPVERMQAKSAANWAAVRRYLRFYGYAALALALWASYGLGWARGALEGWRQCMHPPASGKPH